MRRWREEHSSKVHRQKRTMMCAAVSCVLALPPAGWIGPAVARDFPADDPQLYVVGTAHLDTQWRWTIRETIQEYIPATMQENFTLIEKYPGYVFSFEGAFRYMLMKEYDPASYARVKDYIEAGRWKVAGSWIDAVDVNIPSPESLIRHTLYGNGFFAEEFGVRSRDVYLPDCFGFGYALPSVAAHCGLVGFSTQKLTWGSAVGIPFDLGLWEGVDGSRVVAAINPGAYVSDITGDLSRDSTWTARVFAEGESCGVYAGLRYFGTGDTGGGPDLESVEWLQRSLAAGGPLRVRSAASDQLARDLAEDVVPSLSSGLTPEVFANTDTPPTTAIGRLPVYRGELLMTDHGAGCYTSQSAMKRWNRKNEKLADAAERAAVVAHWLGGLDYPREAFREAWIRFLWHHFHDDLTGTSIPEAYTFSWNDEVLALNRFAEILESSVGAVGRALSTDTEGTPLIVYNSLSIGREDVVTADIRFDRPTAAVRIFGPNGEEVPAQLQEVDGNQARVVFLARVPSIGFSVYEARASKTGCSLDAGLRVTESSLENRRYRVELNGSGDVASIYDKAAGRDLLSAPVTLQMLEDEPYDWAAWEVDYDDVTAAPRSVVAGPAEIRVLERGPARAALEIVRHREGSTFRQQIRLAGGDGAARVEIAAEVDWRTPATLLKAAFPLAVSNAEATYDLGLGTIRRGIDRPELYEVPAQQWADITDASGDYGVAVLNDCRYGWDKPDERTLRLTLQHTPRVNERWSWIDDQNSQDLGRHRLQYALCGHAGSWQEGGIVWEAERLNQPLLAFQAQKHPGRLGREFSFLSFESTGGSPAAVAVKALKLAENTDDLVLRLQELSGREGHAELDFAAPVTSGQRLNGAEERISGTPEIRRGRLVCDLRAYEPWTASLQLEAPAETLKPPLSRPLDLPFDLDGISRDEDRMDGDFDGHGHNLAGELLPQVIRDCGVSFRTGPQNPGAENTVVCRGQTLELPSGDFDKLYILAAAVDGHQSGDLILTMDDGTSSATREWFLDYATPIAQWDSRLASGRFTQDAERITPAYAQRRPVAWFGTHRHDAGGGNEPYRFTYLFKHTLDLPPGARRLLLPDNERIRVLAVTLATNPNDSLRPAQPLYDDARRSAVEIRARWLEFVESTQVALYSPNPGARIHYTLDGGDPTEQSPLYAEPIPVTETTTVKARALVDGMDSDFVATATFTRRIPRGAVSAPGSVPGLRCDYVEGAWRVLPAFDTLQVIRSDVESAIGLPPYAREEDFGLRFTGYLQVPRKGLYTLHLSSDDGSKLWIHGDEVIDNDGLHGDDSVAGNVALEAGLHPLRVEFFQHLGGRALALKIEGPGLELQDVPAGWLFHEPE